jgi:hypothetical protein
MPVDLLLRDDVEMALKPQRTTPKEVTLSAYRAAIRGRFAEASALVAPELKKELAHTHAAHAEVIADIRRLRRYLVRLKGRRGKRATQGRKTFRSLIRINQQLAGMFKQMQTPEFHNEAWKAFGRSVVSAEATRQVIRGSRATVYLRLTLRDGRTVRDRESLVRRGGRWLLG